MASRARGKRKAPLTATSRATILVARRRGDTYRQIGTELGCSQGAINDVVKWQKGNPELAAEEVARVFGRPDGTTAVPIELAGRWAEAVETTLATAMDILKKIATSDKGPSERLHRVTGLLKVLASQAHRVGALLEGEPKAPAVNLNVTQTVGIVQVTEAEKKKAEDWLLNLQPTVREQFLDALEEWPDG